VKAGAALAPLLLAVVIGSAYANVVAGDFVYDDVGSIVENPYVHWRKLGVDEVVDAARRSTTRRAVANVSFGLTWWLAREDVRVYHLTNLAVHWGASWLVYLLALELLRGARAPARKAARAKRKQGRRGNAGPAAEPAQGTPDPRALQLAALVTALVFAAHPLQTQAVSYIVQRMASMAGFFCLLSLWCYVRARTGQTPRPRVYFATSLVAWLLAVGSKESAASFPAIVWAYEWLFHQRADARWALRSAALLAVAAVPMVGLAYWNYGDPFRDYAFHDFTVFERLLSQPRVFFYYAGLIALPLPDRLVLMHDFATSRGLLEPWTTALSWVALLALLALALRERRRRPLPVFGALWALVALSVESSVFPLRLVHEHRLYLPMAGVVLAVSPLWAWLAARSRATAAAVGALMVVLLVVATHVRNRVWSDEASLWADVVAKSPGLAIGYNNLGAAYVAQDRWDEAERLFREARRVDPTFGSAYRSLAGVALHRGEVDASIPLFERAAELDPLSHFGLAQVGMALTMAGREQEALGWFERAESVFVHPQILYHHGKTLLRLGRARESVAMQRRALALDPDHAYAHVGLAAAVAALGHAGEARAELERALAIEDLADAHLELARLDWSQGRVRAAVSRLEALVEADDPSLLALNNLAWMLATTRDARLRDPQRALQLAERSIARMPSADAGLLDTRAAAEAALGDFASALATARRAQELARAQGDIGLAEEIAARASRYARGRPWRDGDGDGFAGGTDAQ